MSKSLNEEILKRYNSKSIESYIQRSKSTVFDEKFLESIISKIPKGGKFLDAGCGTGNFLKQLFHKAQEMNRSDISFFGFDFSHKMIKESEKELSKLNIKLFQDDLKNLKTKEKFDYIFSRDVIFFFDDMEIPKAFKNLQELSNQNCQLHIIICEERFDKEYRQEKSPRNDFSENKLRKTLTQNGFIIDKSKIGEKTSYGKKSAENLDNLYNRLEVISHFDQEALKNPNTNPTLSEIHSENRESMLKNKAKNTTSQIF